MNKSHVLALYKQDQKKIEFPDMQRIVTSNVVRHIDFSKTGSGLIASSQLSEANADDVIQEEVRYFENTGQDFKWKVYDYDQPSDLKEKLASKGFIIQEAEAIMVLDLEEAPDVLWQPSHHDVRRIIHPEQLVDVKTVEDEVWEEDSSWVFHYLGGALRKYPDRMSVYVGYIDKQPASAAWIFFPKNSRFASLWGDATISRFRKQGLFTALVAIRTQKAKARQLRYLSVEAMSMSRPIFGKLGFEVIASAYPCQWKQKFSK